MGGALRSPCPGRRVSPSPGPPELPALRAGCATAGVLRASGPWRARLPWLRASRLEPGGRMELATRSQVRVRRLAAAPTSPGPAFPLLPALLPALGWKRGPWLRRCGSGVPSPAEPARPTGVRSGSRLCQPEWRDRAPPHSGAGLGPRGWVPRGRRPRCCGRESQE